MWQVLYTEPGIRQNRRLLWQSGNVWQYVILEGLWGRKYVALVALGIHNHSRRVVHDLLAERDKIAGSHAARLSSHGYECRIPDQSRRGLPDLSAMPVEISALPVETDIY